MKSRSESNLKSVAKPKTLFHISLRQESAYHSFSSINFASSVGKFVSFEKTRRLAVSGPRLLSLFRLSPQTKAAAVTDARRNGRIDAKGGGTGVANAASPRLTYNVIHRKAGRGLGVNTARPILIYRIAAK
ncbi:hypothetical protein EVAR_92424_1 [Eumeta japonica]|uniref:Uncharacterized protein n=1 Tax=Eumeta variegata TaxID=151549 RepID=A0A4C1T8J7_EUMVA|nr:hypothetical protein EVAR_92424_1 [Eumeta japonica]